MRMKPKHNIHWTDRNCVFRTTAIKQWFADWANIVFYRLFLSIVKLFSLWVGVCVKTSPHHKYIPENNLSFITYSTHRRQSQDKKQLLLGKPLKYGHLFLVKDLHLFEEVR